MARRFIFRQTNAISGLLTDLVASYSFNNNLTENTGLSPNGTDIGLTYTGGVFGNAINFNSGGSDSRVDIADSDNFSFTTGGGNDVAFSISTWVYFVGFSSIANWLINKRGNTSGTDEWQLLYLAGNIYFNKIDRTNNGIYQGLQSSGVTISTGGWYHIVITDDGSKTYAGMKMYINGSLVTTTDISLGTYTGMPNGNAITRFGNAGWNPIAGFRHNGYMQQTNIYKGKTLTSTEVTELNTKAYPF